MPRNLCNSCKYEFATCEGKPTFDADRDSVIKCNCYKKDEDDENDNSEKST